MNRLRAVLPFVVAAVISVSMLLLVSLVTTNDARASHERAKLGGQVSDLTASNRTLQGDVDDLQGTVKSAYDLVLQFQSDNAALREQLASRGIKPVVPARPVVKAPVLPKPTTTRPPTPPATTTPPTTVPPSGSGPAPTTCMVAPVCLNGTCTPCIP